MTSGKEEHINSKGAAGQSDRPSWVADKTVHATVDSINSAIGEMIAADGGLPPIVPPGAAEVEVPAGSAGEAPAADKKAHASR